MTKTKPSPLPNEIEVVARRTTSRSSGLFDCPKEGHDDLFPGR